MNARAGYLPTLDGWRAVAIVAVIADHFVAWHAVYLPAWTFPFTHAGADGVSLFFAISGFLICSRLIEEEAAAGRISLRGFYTRRAARILPAALTYLAVIGALGLAGYILLSPWEWWSALFFFRNYVPPAWIKGGAGEYTQHFWSLAVEEQFYLLWPGVLVLAGRRRALYVATSLSILVASWRWWDSHHHVFGILSTGVYFNGRTDVRLDGLLLGCLAALLLARPGIRNSAARMLGWPAWTCCAGLYLGIQLKMRHHTYSIGESALLVLIVVGTVLQPRTWMGRILEVSPLRWIGRISYSLYLWQQFFLIKGNHRLSRIQSFPLDLILIFTVAALSYRFIERPLIRLGHRFAPPPSPGHRDLGR